MKKLQKLENMDNPTKLFEDAADKFYKVYDFDPKTKKSDRHWIRVGLIPDPNKEVKWNFFDGERLLCDEPFDKAEVFTDGRAIVIRNNEYNVLKDDGTFVFDRWYHYVCACDDGKHYIVEEKKDEYGLIRKEAFADHSGKIVTEWYDQTTPMMHDMLYCVAKGEKIPERKFAVLDVSTGKLMTEWYDSMMMFMWKDFVGQPFARVRKGNLHNFIGVDCKPVFSIWSKKQIEVEKDGSCQLTAEDGTVYNANVKTGETEKI